MGFNSLLKRRRVSTGNSLNLLPALEEDEGRHGSHAKFLGDVRRLVDVDLVEADVRVLVAEFLEGGSDGDAGAAPGGEAVDYDGFAGLGGLDGGMELVLAAGGCVLEWCYVWWWGGEHTC